MEVVDQNFRGQLGLQVAAVRGLAAFSMQGTQR